MTGGEFFGEVTLPEIGVAVPKGIDEYSRRCAMKHIGGCLVRYLQNKHAFRQQLFKYVMDFMIPRKKAVRATAFLHF